MILIQKKKKKKKDTQITAVIQTLPVTVLTRKKIGNKKDNPQGVDAKCLSGTMTEERMLHTIKGGWEKNPREKNA